MHVMCGFWLLVRLELWWSVFHLIVGTDTRWATEYLSAVPLLILSVSLHHFQLSTSTSLPPPLYLHFSTSNFDRDSPEPL
jgi:hypothetical protein